MNLNHPRPTISSYVFSTNNSRLFLSLTGTYNVGGSAQSPSQNYSLGCKKLAWQVTPFGKRSSEPSPLTIKVNKGSNIFIIFYSLSLYCEFTLVSELRKIKKYLRSNITRRLYFYSEYREYSWKRFLRFIKPLNVTLIVAIEKGNPT